MSVPIERIDPDDLLVEAGRMQDNALTINTPGSRVIAQNVATVLHNYSKILIGCAGYIRFLETLAFQPDGETWKELAECRGRLLDAEAALQQRQRDRGAAR